MKRLPLILLLIASILMSVPFLVPHTGLIALIALVPLLCAERLSDDVKGYFWWRYLALIIFNALTTFWVWNATAAGAILAIVLNALQMALVFEVARWSKKWLSGVLPYIFLMVLWLSFERQYFAADVSWPWLTFGNAFARTTHLVQWYEYTGLLGGSLWVWLVNLSLFGLMVSFSDGRFFETWRPQARIAALAGIAALIIVPIASSLHIYHSYREVAEDEPLSVLVTQTNIDPYHKFESLSQAQQNDILTGLIRGSVKEDYDLIVAPETFTSDVQIAGSDTLSRTVETLRECLRERCPEASLLVGASAYEFLPANAPHSESARHYGSSWVESYNVALAIDADHQMEMYKKSRLVVIVEKIPWTWIFRPLDDALGGVFGRCIGQESASLMHVGDVPYGAAICYESIYPEYFASFVAQGAKFMTVITNDAWWGNTPGYKQHLSYSCLRAIETRRDIVRCANTGISAYIDQKGDIVTKTDWWQKQTLYCSANLNSNQTFYVENGDIVGRVAFFVLALLSLLIFVQICLRRKF